MESSRRAVEAYRCTRLIDHVSADDDKIAPVYRLDEISHTLRSSSTDIVREMCEYTVKRLGSRSPRVKQKILRMIKYVVGKGGPEFRRQMQRQSAAVRQLFAYKGQVDALRGDALNKAVRDTAHEAISAIFASDDKLPQTEQLSKRIMGFGSTNSDMPAEGKKSLINDVVGFGSASIRQGLTIMSGYSGSNTGSSSNESSYRSPSLRKSLTSEAETLDRFEREATEDLRVPSEEVSSRTKHSDSRFPQHEASNGSGGAKNSQDLSQEERLLDTITAPGGMRLQPARENLQTFIANALKLDPRNLGNALKSKLHSHSWQVRLKALCVIDEILRQKNHDFFRIVAKVLEEDAGIIKDCLQSPQTSVREKAKKVLDHLGDLKEISDKISERPADPKDAPPSIVHNMPDLIDTRELDLLDNVHNLADLPASTSRENISTMNSTSEDILGEGGLGANAEAISGTSPDDLFAGVSIHTSDVAVCETTGDFFSGLSVDNRASGDGGVDLLLNNSLDTEKYDFSAFSQPAHSDKLADLMGSVTLSNSGNGGPLLNGSGENGVSCAKSASVQGSHHSNALPSQILGSLSSHQMIYVNPSLMLPTGMVQGYQAPVMMSQNFGAGTLGNAFFQQQLISGMAGLQRFGMGAMMVNGRNLQGNVGSGGVLGDSFVNGFDFSVDATLRHTAAANFTTKEDTKAFDFITDHVCAARGPKKVP